MFCALPSSIKIGKKLWSWLCWIGEFLPPLYNIDTAPHCMPQIPSRRLAVHRMFYRTGPMVVEHLLLLREVRGLHIPCHGWQFDLHDSRQHVTTRIHEHFR